MLELGGELLGSSERRVEDGDGEAAALQVGRKVEDAKGRMGFHDLPLVGILREVVSVSQEHIHGD